MPKQGPVHTYDMLPRSIDLGYIARDASLTDAAVPTGEIHAAKLQDNTLDLGGAKTIDYSLTDTKVPTGELTFRRLKRAEGSVAALPDVATEVVHNLNVVPEYVSLTPGDAGVVGYPILVDKTTTSLLIKANVSGVETYWYVVA